MDHSRWDSKHRSGWQLPFCSDLICCCLLSGFLGLTASSGIGEYVTELYCQLIASPSSSSPSPPPQQHCQNRSFLNDLTEGDIAADGLLGVSVSAHSPLTLEEVNQSPQPTTPRAIVLCPPVPPLESLAEDFQDNLLQETAPVGHGGGGASRGAEHGSVTLYGRQCRVTHPITSFGLESFRRSESLLTDSEEGREEPQ
jgi:hypothetical protein